MKKIRLLSLVLFTYPFFTYASCGGIKPCDFITCQPGYHCVNGKCVKDPTPPPECLPGIPWCDQVNQTCSKPDSPCKHNPTSDPNHCELAPACPPEDPCQNIICKEGYHCVAGECVKNPDPCDNVTCNPGFHCEKGNCVPDNNLCPKELAPGAVVFLKNKAYGNGFDSSPRVKGDTEFCRLIHGVAVDNCNLEGWSKRAECEYYLLGNNCPVWEYRSNGIIYFCHDDKGAIASCDHYGDPVNRDDPQTPTTGDTLETLKGFEGEPKVCGLHRDSFGPYQGFFVIAHGKAEIRVCKPDRNPTTCGTWLPFDH